MKKFMRLTSFSLLAAMVVVKAATAQTMTPSFDEVSRCFFVYAGITEAGRDYKKAQLFQFGLPRSSWAGGFLQANLNNQEFKAVFERNLSNNKIIAIRIRDSLNGIYARRDQRAFDDILDQAMDCDRMAGIRTSFLPTME